MYRVRNALQAHGDRLRLIAVAIAVIVLLIGIFAPSTGLLGYGIVLALVAVQFAIRVRRGPAIDSEIDFVAKVRKHLDNAGAEPSDPTLLEPRARLTVPKGSSVKQSRHLRRVIQERWQDFDKDEVFVLELRRHPLSTLPVKHVLALLGALAQGVVATKGLLLLGIALFAVLLGVLTYLFPVVMFLVAAAFLVMIVCLWVRYWLVQTIAFTNRHMIVCSGWRTDRARIVPLPRFDEVEGVSSGLASLLARLRFVGVAWGELVYVQKDARGTRVVAHPASVYGVPGALRLPGTGLFPARVQELPPVLPDE